MYILIETGKKEKRKDKTRVMRISLETFYIICEYIVV